MTEARRRTNLSTPRRKPWRWAWALLAALVALCAWRALQGDDTLLAGARPIDARNIRLIGWVSDTEVLAYSPRYPSQEAVLLDLQTGARKPLPGLTAAIQATAPQIKPFVHRAYISPDGKWLLYANHANPARTPITVCAARVDGTKTITWSNLQKMNEAWSLQWDLDSNRWYRFRMAPYLGSAYPHIIEALEYRLDRPASVVSREADAPQFMPHGVLAGDRAASYESGSPYSRWPERRPAMQVDTLDLSEPSLPLAKTTVHFPEPADGCFFTVAPRGDRVTFDVVQRPRAEGNALARLLDRLTGRDKANQHIVCTSDDRFTHVEEVGRMRTVDDPKLGGDPFWVLGFSPSGRRMAFLVKETVYVKDMR